MRLWTPHLWTPRAKRLLMPQRFAAGDVLLDASGNVILDADGNVMLSDGAGDDCCCGGCDICTDIDYFTVTIAGSTTCSSCVSNGSFGFRASGTINGTYQLDSVSACEWGYSVGSGGPFTVDGYDTTCTIPAGTSTDLVIQLRFTVSGGNLLVRFSVSTGGSGGQFLVVTGAGNEWCTEAVLTDTNTPCDIVSGGIRYAGGGTATFTPAFL